MNFRQFTVLCLATIILISCGDQNKKRMAQVSTIDSEEVFEPNWESIEKNYEDPHHRRPINPV